MDIETSFTGTIPNYEYSYDLTDAFKYPLHTEVFISLFVWSIWFLTIAGNILVFASFITDRTLLYKVSNLFILNLASADLLVGFNSLTFNNLWRYYGNWPFGESICKMWMVLDFAATLQSTLAIVLISMDRYLMVTMGLKYRPFMTHYKTCFLIGFTWCTSLMFFAVPVLSYPFWAAKTWQPRYDITCDIAVLYIKSYNIITIVYGFVIPVLLLVFFNAMIFVDIRKRSGGLLRSRLSQVAPLPMSSLQRAKPQSSMQDSSGNRLSTIQGRGRIFTRHTVAQEEIFLQQINRDKGCRLTKDRKAAVTSAVIVCAYILCWLPYYIVQMIYVYHGTNANISWVTWNSVYYLIWSNSALNPFLYAITSPRMRKTFIKLICIWKNDR